MDPQKDEVKEETKEEKIKVTKKIGYFGRVALLLVMLSIIGLFIFYISERDASDRITDLTSTTETTTTLKPDTIEHEGEQAGYIKWTVDEVVAQLKVDKLVFADERKMTVEDYELAPREAIEGVRFFMPALGDGVGGRILSFDDEADLLDTKKFYDGLEKLSDELAATTIRRDNVLIQFDNQVPQDLVKDYEASLSSLK